MEVKELMAKAIEVRKKYAEFEKIKFGKEWSNEQIAEGLVGDVGDLMKLVMAKEGIRKIDDVDSKLAHELSDCLWCILILADKYGVDIEKSFDKTMDELKSKLS